MSPDGRRTLWELIHEARSRLGERDGDAVARFMMAWASTQARHPDRPVTAVDLHGRGLSRRSIEQGRRLFVQAFPDETDPTELLRRTGALADAAQLSGGGRINEVIDALRSWRRQRRS